jgi:hypothetical protein
VDDILKVLFGLPFIFFCLAISAVTVVLRKVIEYILENPRVPTSKNSKIWKELVLPIAPVVIGPVWAFLAPTYPFSEHLTTGNARVIIGLVAGLFSGLVYRVVKAFVVKDVPAIKNDDELDPEIINKVRDSIGKQ